jgi:hypothetical protein
MKASSVSSDSQIQVTAGLGYLMVLTLSAIWALGIVPLESVSTGKVGFPHENLILEGLLLRERINCLKPRTSVTHRVLLCTGLDASPAERLLWIDSPG